MQSRKASAYEALINNILGLLISFIVLTIFGMPFLKSISIMGIMFIASNVRSYVVRRFFNLLTVHHNKANLLVKKAVKFIKQLITMKGTHNE